MSVVAIALAVWLFQFATHVHNADPADSGPHKSAQHCTFCAAFPAGAGPVAEIIHIVTSRAVAAGTEVLSPGVKQAVSISYQSRAPPV